MKKDLNYYLNLNYPMTIIKDVEDGEVYYIADLPDLPGCGAHGRTVDEAIKSLEEAKELWIEMSLEKGMQIPEPVSDEEFSGKYLLRMPPKLHMKLTTMAKTEELSLNQFIRKTLEINLTLEMILKKTDQLEQQIKQLREDIEPPEETSNAIWKSCFDQPGLQFYDLSASVPVNWGSFAIEGQKKLREDQTVSKEI